MQPRYLDYPTMEEVQAATQWQLARWYRFLPVSENEYQVEVIEDIIRRFKDNGGMTPELSKKIGWEL